MSESVIQMIFDDGYKSSFIILSLVCSYKLYKLKCDSHSEGDCCRWLKFKLNTQNEGGNDDILDQRISNV